MRITPRLILFIALAAVAPVVIYGVVSVNSLRAATRDSVLEGNQNVARRVAEQLEQYVTGNIKILNALAADLQHTGLQTWQQDRILKNYVLAFPEFRELTLLDPSGAVRATSRVGVPQVRRPGPDAVAFLGGRIDPAALDDDLLPRTTVELPVRDIEKDAGVLVGEFNLVEMWRVVDAIRVGQSGFALVTGRDGRLIAHGNPDKKRAIARAERVQHCDMGLAGGSDTARTYRDEAGTEFLCVAAPLPGLGWTVAVEQPTREALAIALRSERQLAVAICAALTATLALGYLFGRSLIRPIYELMNATDRLARGNLSERVAIASHDELAQLGTAFNDMADHLVALQHDVRRQERQAMFGRIAVGLVHDLSHPIKNIANSCKLILKMHDDPEYRETFRRTVDRESMAIKRVLDDLRNLARPIPLERFRVDLNRSLTDVFDAMVPAAEVAGVTLECDTAPQNPAVEGDLFALGRVYRNLILNALQATAPGGVVRLSTRVEGDRAIVSVEDTGCGIPPDRLGAVFDDFMTTKHRGLGLGLAISRKIVEQLDGRIAVESTVGVGTTFTMSFPLLQTAAQESV